MNYLSVCSGIEAATVAWHPLGWTPLAFSEIEKFPCALLAKKYPTVPNLGDMTKFQEWPDLEPNILVGGTPCQSFSVAGLRKGLDDPRGNLTLTYLAIAARYRPAWVVWENVPGVLSDAGNAFGNFLAGLSELGYGWAYRILDAQYVRVESHPRAVPQRRRRVFVVGYLGDWRRAAAVLFERESLCGHPAPRREAGQGIASRAGCGFEVGGTLGPQVSRLTTDECAQGAAIVAHSLKAEGFDASEDGTGRGIQDWETETFVLERTEGGFDDPIPFDTTQITSAVNRANPRAGDSSHPLAAHAHAHVPAIAFSCKDYGADAGEVAPTLRSMEFDGSHANRGGQVAIAFGAQNRVRVRRLTPTECERLQGFPDGYTNVPYRGKPAVDGPRYRALGNSMAVNVMRWIGERIASVEAIKE